MKKQIFDNRKNTKKNIFSFSVFKRKRNKFLNRLIRYFFCQMKQTIVGVAQSSEKNRYQIIFKFKKKSESISKRLGVFFGFQVKTTVP